MESAAGLTRGAQEAEAGMTCFATKTRTPSFLPCTGRSNMSHHKFSVLRVLILTGVALGLSAAGTLAAAQTVGSDGEIPTDSAVTVGILPNGLTYYVRANDQPETEPSCG